MRLFYVLHWRCEGCRGSGTHAFAIDVGDGAGRYLLYQGGKVPAHVVAAYDAEVCLAEVDHFLVTGCRGRVVGEGGYLRRVGPDERWDETLRVLREEQEVLQRRLVTMRLQALQERLATLATRVKES